jgi:hypothetical protein
MRTQTAPGDKGGAAFVFPSRAASNRVLWTHQLAEALPVSIDPRAPTSHHPGSKGKLRVLRARARAEVALFHPQDAEGARQLQTKTQVNSGPKPIERAILGVLRNQPMPVRELKARTGCRSWQNLRRALTLLRDAGVVERGKRGWRLARV